MTLIGYRQFDTDLFRKEKTKELSHLSLRTVIPTLGTLRLLIQGQPLAIWLAQDKLLSKVSSIDKNSYIAISLPSSHILQLFQPRGKPNPNPKSKKQYFYTTRNYRICQKIYHTFPTAPCTTVP